MKLRKLTCPNCDGELELKTDKETSSVFCPYCGQKFFLDEEQKVYKINKTVNVNKNIHTQHTDDAEIIKAQLKDKEDRRAVLVLAVGFGVSFGILLLMAVLESAIPYFNGLISESQGKVNAGYYGDLIGEDYETVEAHFEAAGFTDIELVDLNDAGLAFWSEGKVDMISIGGDTSFDSNDWFSPDTTVVISYH